MKVTYTVQRGEEVCIEVETYLNQDSAIRGIQDRIRDPYSPTVVAVDEIRDVSGRIYDLEWAAILIPALLQAA